MQNPFFRGYCLLLGGLLLALLMDYLGLFVVPNHAAYDLAFRFRGARQPDPRVFLVTIDDPSLARLGRWPLPRGLYADLLRRLQPAAAIGLDILFLEPTRHDADLARAIAANGRVVLPGFLAAGTGFREPLPSLGARQTGHVHLEQDIDGVVRTVALQMTHDDRSMPAFASQIVSLAAPHASVLQGEGSESPPPGEAAVTSQSHIHRIDFYGPTGTFPGLSLSEVLAGRHPPGGFADRIVLVGMTATGSGEEFTTPFFQNREGMPGVEVQAHIVSNLLQGDCIHPAGAGATWALAALLGAAGLGLRLRWHSARAALLWLALPAAAAALVATAFARFGIWVPPAPLFTALAISLLVSYIVRLAHAHRLLQQAHADLEDIFDTIDDAIVIQDPNGGLVRTNRAGRQLATHPELQARWRALRAGLEPAVAQTGSHRPVVDEIYDSGSGRTVEIRQLARADARGRFMGTLQVIRDLTAQKRLGAEYQRLESQLVQAHKLEAIGMLASGIAHDFNNVLSIILGNAELLLLDMPPTAAPRKRVERIFEAGQRARELIRQILLFSRRSQRDAQLQPLLLGPVVKEALKLLTSSLPATIRIRHQIRPHVRIKADPVKIHQVVMNLFTNAYHAMQENGGQLEVVVDEVTFDPTAPPPEGLAPGRFARLMVSDTGGGIAPEIRERIFDAHFTTKPPGIGTGLGLSTVQSIIQGYAGLVTVESEIGRGSTFSVFLPFESDAPQMEKTASASPLLPGAGRILMVDDEVELAKTQQALLERNGYTVHTQTRGPAALAEFKADPYGFDLAILDLTMPEITGDRLAGEMLRLRPDFPILLCTGSDERISEKALAAIGVKGFALKPLGSHELLKRVQELIKP